MLINSAKARKMFDRHSFLNIDEDVIPAGVVRDLFGKEAALCAVDAMKQGIRAIVTVDAGNGRSHFCLTYDGFLQAGAYHNWQEVRERDSELFGGISPVKVKAECEPAGGKIIDFARRIS